MATYNLNLLAFVQFAIFKVNFAVQMCILLSTSDVKAVTEMY